MKIVNKIVNKVIDAIEVLITYHPGLLVSRAETRSPGEMGGAAYGRDGGRNNGARVSESVRGWGGGKA